MGLGLWRKIKEFGKKAWKWMKEKAFPTVKKVWQIVKPGLQAIPQTAPLVKTLSPFLGSASNTVPKISTGLDAVKNTVSPFIKLKKNGAITNSEPSIPPHDYGENIEI